MSASFMIAGKLINNLGNYASQVSSAVQTFSRRAREHAEGIALHRRLYCYHVFNCHKEGKHTSRTEFEIHCDNCNMVFIPTQSLRLPDEALQQLINSTYRSSTLSFYLNGTKIDLSNPNPRWTLLDFVRSQHGLKGTKLGCGEGGCGACTVVLQTRETHNDSRKIRHLAINACLYPLVGGENRFRRANFHR